MSGAAAVSERTKSSVGEGRALAGFEPASVTPVKWWAAVGCVFLGLFAYSIGRWLLGGHATPTPTGASSVPTFKLVALRVHEIAFGLGVLFAFYWTIVKPWRRERRITTDGVLFLSCCTLWMTDPLSNYGRIGYVYNAAGLNLGCPQCFLPGWQSRANTYVEPLLLDAFYFGLLVFIIVGGCRLLRWYRQRWPQHGRRGAVLFLLAVTTVFDFVTEALWLRLGLWIYPNFPYALWSDHYYRLPVHEVVFVGCWYTAMICARAFTNDKGETWAERGLSNLQLSSRKRTALRILASIGMYNVAVLVSYHIPMGFHAGTTSRSWPEDVYSRSYYTHQLCGPDTTFACMDPRVPVPVGPKSAHISPTGELIVPDGLPVQRRQE